jgi:hypothetical protein
MGESKQKKKRSPKPPPNELERRPASPTPHTERNVCTQEEPPLRNSLFTNVPAFLNYLPNGLNGR